MNRLCTLDDVKRYVDVVGRWGDEEVYKEIEFQTQDIYEEVGSPIAAMKSTIEINAVTGPHLKYYLGEPNIYGVERVFVGTTTKTEVYETKDFEFAGKVGMLNFLASTVNVSVSTVSLRDSSDLLIYYVPQLFAKYCALKTSESLLESIDVIEGGKVSQDLAVIRRRLAIHEKLINHRLGVAMSSSNAGYDPVYGMNVKTIRQDHDYNEYLWKED